MESTNGGKYLQRSHTGDPRTDEVVHTERVYVPEVERSKCLGKISMSGVQERGKELRTSGALERWGRLTDDRRKDVGFRMDTKGRKGNDKGGKGAV